MEEIKISLYLGMGDEGQHRLEALRLMAIEAGHTWDDKPSPGRLILAMIDRWLEQRQGSDEAELDPN